MSQTGSTPYSTYIKDFRAITAHGQVGDGPEWFRVETQDGVVFEYGTTADSRMEASGRSDVLMWALAKVYDQCGNYMEFEYYDDNTWGEYRIAYIRYTGNSAVPVAPQTQIIFDYEYKPDKNKSWVHGSLVQDVWRVSGIRIQDILSGSVIHKYEFGYNQDFYTHLTSIKETGQDGEALPVTQINWGSAATQYQVTQHNLSLGNMVCNIGDFNGDGLTDIIRTPWIIGGGSEFEYYKSDGNGDLVHVSNTVLPAGNTFSIAINPDGYNLNNKMVFDYNGDGKDDYLIMTHDGDKKDFYVFIFISDGTSFSLLDNAPAFTYSSSHINLVDDVRFIPGDYDGDGKKEIMVAVPNYNSNMLLGYHCYVIGSAYSSILPAYILGESTHMFAADFDGDGIDEIHRSMDGWTPSFQILKLNVDYDAVSRVPYLASGASFDIVFAANYPTQWHRIYPGDFNGDGKKDLLTWTNYGGGQWEIAYSKGNGYEVMTLGGLQQTIDPGAFDETFNYVVADYNGDGKDDILEVLVKNPATNNWHYNIWHAQGNHNFIPDDGEISASEVSSWDQQDMYVADFNGDGQADIFLAVAGRSSLRSVFFSQK